MARTKVCELSYKKAVEAIEGTETVFFKSGVWNPYKEIDTETAKNKISNSDYGADVYEEDGKFYVSCPCGSDMW